MKLRNLAIITLLVLTCTFASAQSYTFGFADVSGYLYCNYEQLTPVGILPGVYQVTDNQSGCCNGCQNGTGVGYFTSFPNKGQPVFGTGVTYGDNIYDTCGYVSGAQWTMFTKLACNKQVRGTYKGKYSWIGVASASGFFFGDNYGYLSCSLPPPCNGDASECRTNAGKPPAKK